MWAYDLPAVTDDAPLRNNIYIEDTTTRSLRTVTVTQQDPLAAPDFFDFPLVWGVSGDAHHIAFVTSTTMLPNAAPGAPNVYKWDDGVLTLAGILPDGSVPAGGSDVVPVDYRGAMSADGSRQLFTASPDGGPAQLYMRVGDSRTVWVSQPEGSDSWTR